VYHKEVRGESSVKSEYVFEIEAIEILLNKKIKEKERMIQNEK